MIPYNPIDGEALTQRVRYRPRTCFLMTKLGDSIPSEVGPTRDKVVGTLASFGFAVVDAETVVTGRDYLLNIWKLILAVPVGIAIICKEMSCETLGNVFFELGIMQACGKETLVVKSPGVNIPSDFVRTQYVKSEAGLERGLSSFIRSVLEIGEHHVEMAENFAESNPLLSIDYLRRAFLVLGNDTLKLRASEVFSSLELTGRARNCVEKLISSF